MFPARRHFTTVVVLLVLACGDGALDSAISSPDFRRAGDVSTELPSNVVYLTTNDPTLGQNAVLAFRRDVSCSLTLLGRFSMGGTGVGNPNFRLGTLESDQSLIVSPDGRFLFAVNAGSNTVAAFSILADGTLVPVEGSPVRSHGRQPAGLAFQDKFLYVTHKNEVPGEDPADFPRPNYTTFRVNPHGKLHAIPDFTIKVPRGSSPTQVLISNDGKFAFSTELLVDFPLDFFPTDGFPAAPGAGGGNTLRSFAIGPHGRLNPIPAIRIPGPDQNFPDPLGLLSGSAHISGTTNGAFALQDHPVEPILYVAFPFRFQVGVYTWNRGTGRLTFGTVVGGSGQMPMWLQVSPDGRFLYVVNRLDSTISVYDLSDPLNPVEIIFRDLRLAPGATSGGLAGQQSLTPDGQCLYVIEQRITDADSEGSANALHALTGIGVTEPFAPINLGAFGVPRTARPQGIAAF